MQEKKRARPIGPSRGGVLPSEKSNIIRHETPDEDLRDSRRASGRRRRIKLQKKKNRRTTDQECEQNHQPAPSIVFRSA